MSSEDIHWLVTIDTIRSAYDTKSYLCMHSVGDNRREKLKKSCIFDHITFMERNTAEISIKARYRYVYSI